MRRCPSRKKVRHPGTGASLPSDFLGLQRAAQKSCAAASGNPTAPHWTWTWWPPELSFSFPSTTAGRGSLAGGRTRPCNTASRITFLAQDTQCGQVVDRFCDQPVVCPCADHRDRSHNAQWPRLPRSGRGQAFALRKKSQASSNPTRTPTGSRDAPAPTALPTWMPGGEGSTPEAWDLAVTSCLRPASRNPDPLSATTQNLADQHSRGHSTTRVPDSIRTASVSPQWFSTATLAGGVTPHLGQLDLSQRLSATCHRAPHDTNIELAHRVSSSLHRDSARFILRRVRSVATRNARPSP